MRLLSLLGAALLLFASAAGATPPAPSPAHVVIAPRPPAPRAPIVEKAPPHVTPIPAIAKTPPGAMPPPTSPLFAPKRPEEAPDAFFSRAAHEVAKTSTVHPGQLTPTGREAVESLARAAGYDAIRNVVVGGGVVGSQSGNSYVLYYRNGWTDANLHSAAPSKATEAAPPKATEPPPPPPAARRDPALESEIRTMLAKTPDGRRALEQLDHAKTTILFRDGGGTSNNGDQHELYVDVKMNDGSRKPTSWLALSVAHEASHAYDDATGATPRTVSPLHDEYAAKKATTTVPMTLRISLVKERADYVDRQVAGEARAMTTETRLRRDLEAQGVDFQKLTTNLLDPYNQAVATVYAAAGVTAP